MATKVKADLVFELNALAVYYDDNTKVINSLSTFDYGDLMEVINDKNANEFTIKMVSLNLSTQSVFVFSELWYSETQIVKSWLMDDFTAPQQTIINDFIDSL